MSKSKNTYLSEEKSSNEPNVITVEKKYNGCLLINVGYVIPEELELPVTGISAAEASRRFREAFKEFQYATIND